MRRAPPWRTSWCRLAAAAGVACLIATCLAATCLAATCLAATCLVAAWPASAGATSPPADVAALVADLGAADAAVREQATARLAADVAGASDALLAAAESATDPEVALRARWLLDSLPLAAPHDAPEAADVLARLATATGTDRRLALHELLRLDREAGIEPLARLVRLDRPATEAVTAAALLAGEWRPDTAAWQRVRGSIVAGLGPSDRPAARFLRALAAAGAASTAAAAADSCTAAVAAVEQLAVAGADPAAVGVLRRCLAALLARSGRRDEAVAEADRLFAARASAAGDARGAFDLVWLAAHGLPDAVDAFRSRYGERLDREPLLAYAAAVAERARGREAEAGVAADAAFAAAATDDPDVADRLRLALLLCRWGAFDWAAREYEAVLNAADDDPARFALGGVYLAESLHDQGRDAEAAAVLGRVLQGHGSVSAKDMLERVERDPAVVRARMHFFESCDAAVRGDVAATRRCLEDGLRSFPQEVDALIGLFRLPDATAAERAEARRLVEAAADRIEDRIEALPENTDAYNEYAWLVANTVGDFSRAERYARVAIGRHARLLLESRQASPFDGGLDSSSYLDTLAHCRAAAGDLPGAIRIQSLAVALEPHGRILRLNLEAFQARAREARP
jgi:tetratricopeptide (TPR) repeat protein